MKQDMKFKLLAVFILFPGILSAAGSEKQQFKTISGVISLPENYPVTENKIRIQLNIREKKFSGPQNERLYVYIPKGRKSVSYNFKMPVTDDKVTYALSYICWEKGLVRSAFYGRNGMVPFKKGIIDYDGRDVFRFFLDKENITSADIKIYPDPQVLSLDEMNALAEEKGREIIGRIIKPGMTDFEKELVIYEWISENVKYYNNEIAAQKMEGMDDIWNKKIGPLLHGVAECSSFAEAFSFLMNEAGVETMLAWAPGHLWNVSKISGKWYNVDTTWNWAGYRWMNVPSIQYPHVSRNKNNPECNTVFSVTEKDYPNRGLLSRKDKLRISGDIILPAGINAPKGGIEVTIKESESRTSKVFVIAENQSRAFFMISLDREKIKKGMKLSYSVKHKDLSESGYYNPRERAKSSVKAEVIPYSDMDKTGIKFILSRR